MTRERGQRRQRQTLRLQRISGLKLSIVRRKQRGAKQEGVKGRGKNGSGDYVNDSNECRSADMTPDNEGAPGVEARGGTSGVRGAGVISLRR